MGQFAMAMMIFCYNMLLHEKLMLCNMLYAMIFGFGNRLQVLDGALKIL